MRARAKDERGTIMMMTAFIVVGALLMVGLVIDQGQLRVDRRLNKSLTDVAARAGVGRLPYGPQSGACEARQYLLANARKGGPVDTLRWGSALARVSRLMDIPVEVLHRKFGKTGQKEANRPISGQNVETIGSGNGSKRPADGRDLAESQVLGVLLLEPKRWAKVQTVVAVEDFVDTKLRAVAQVYWDHQREEGEPVFNEFIDSLKEAELKSLAIELADAVEEMDLEVTLSGALEYLSEMKHRRAEEKMVATLRRTGDEQELSEEEQVKLLVKLQESARRPDLRRVGR